MKRSRLLLLLLVLALPGLFQCASVSKAPSEQAEAAKSFEPVEDKATVFLYRPGRAVGAASATQIKVNSLDAGGTGPGSFFRWEMKPGKYTFLASTSESSATVALDVEAGQFYFIELITKIGLSDGRVKMKQVDESKGKSAVKSLTMAVSAYTPE